jgi:biopolymer transport protein ExbD
MSYIPYDELRPKEGFNLAPMIDFLFLMLAFFASLAVSRVALQDTDIELVRLRPESALSDSSRSHADYKIVHLTIDEQGHYLWKTELRDHVMTDSQEIAEELEKQQERGLLPEERSKTQVLVKIDRRAPWEPIVKLIFSVREAGYEIRPVYEPDCHPQTCQ